MREKAVLKQAEKYTDRERTLGEAEKDNEAAKAALMTDQTRIAQELADVEKAKTEQATIHEQNKAERAEVKLIKAELAVEFARIEAESSELANERATVTKQLEELALREKAVLKQAEKYTDRERTLGEAEKGIDAVKATLMADQARLVQELAELEKAKAEQATVQAQTKAEWADVKVLKDKLAAENCRNEAEASELENDQMIVKKQLAELAVREKIVLKQAEKYADHEHTLSKVEKEIESLKASVLADQTHLAQELATVEKLKAEQAADQTKTKAEWAEIKIYRYALHSPKRALRANSCWSCR